MKKTPAQLNCPWLIPHITVRDAARSMDFYEKAFGFAKGMSMPGENGKIMHAEMQYQGLTILMMASEGSTGCPSKSPATSNLTMPMNFYVYTPDVNALYQQALRAGAETRMPPRDMFWGDRICLLKDIDGYEWMFGTNVADFDPKTAADCGTIRA